LLLQLLHVSCGCKEVTLELLKLMRLCISRRLRLSQLVLEVLQLLGGSVGICLRFCKPLGQAFSLLECFCLASTGSRQLLAQEVQRRLFGFCRVLCFSNELHNLVLRPGSVSAGRGEFCFQHLQGLVLDCCCFL
jgi:hypothetical protein